MRSKLYMGVALFALFAPAAAMAQSTGSIEFGEDIVVTGRAQKDVGGVEVPDAPKTKVTLDRELLLRQTPGQTVNDMINLVPGVSFTNNDPFGSLGGSFTIRGFSSDRISQTVDGIPLNDSGNYALYTNQQQDPETLESVTVSLGSTDADSPTASAVGGTINIRTRTPSDEMGVLAVASYGNIVARGNPGDRWYHRGFVMFDTGDFTGFGTKAWFSASKADNKSTFSNYGGVDKQQYNGRIYQEIGTNGDFVSVSGHYNQNRNNFNGSPLSNVAYPLKPSSRFYEIDAACQIDAPTAGVVDTPNSCGSEFERRYNPSNTGNVRINSRFTLAQGLTLTVDPSFQYVKANGGGTSYAIEGRDPSANALGVIYGKDPRYNPTRNNTYYYVGNVDLNGDNEYGDVIRVLSPSQTTTRRYAVIANLAYELNPLHRFRVSYTFDRARHRQTGAGGLLAANGEPFDVFPINDPILDENGVRIGKRDRLSYATLNLVAGEYRGKFLNEKLTTVLGLTQKWFSRDLNQHCFTTDASGNVNCVTDNIAAYAAAHPTYAAPQSRSIDYSKLLPHVGFTYEFMPNASLFASYDKGISVPGTDALYGALYFPAGSVSGQPKPETTDSFDAGVRYQSPIVQAQLTGWYTKYTNRLASAYDPDCDCSVTRNLGGVEKWGIDGSISAKPIPDLLLYVFGSYLKSRIEDDVQTGATSFAATKGKREAGAPKYMIGARVQGTLGPVDLGAQIKRTGERYLNDINTVTLPGYTVVDLDVRYSLADMGLSKSYFQLNVTNLFDEVYIGSASGGLTTTSSFVNIGPPRALIGSLVIGF
ncbi:MAG: TonB-dependent receptor [Pseudomonadota bacterium]